MSGIEVAIRRMVRAGTRVHRVQGEQGALAQQRALVWEIEYPGRTQAKIDERRFTFHPKAKGSTGTALRWPVRIPRLRNVFLQQRYCAMVHQSSAVRSLNGDKRRSAKAKQEADAAQLSWVGWRKDRRVFPAPFLPAPIAVPTGMALMK